MKDKKLIIILIFLILTIAVILVVFKCLKKPVQDYVPERPSRTEIEVQTPEISKYIDEYENDLYHLKMLESEDKDNVSLFIETNIYDGEKTFEIKYNNQKLNLNTANPLLENEKIETENNISNIKVKLQSLQNYKISFFKKSIETKIEKQDIVVSCEND